MGNIMNLFGIIGMAKRNPQQGYQSGSVNQQQYDLLMGQLQNGANPNMIIQQMLNSGMANQQMYESARQQAGSFNRR